MTLARILLATLLCLACGALGVVIAYMIVGDRQPGYLLIAGAAGVIIAGEWAGRGRPRP
jgi:hypothetical protein